MTRKLSWALLLGLFSLRIASAQQPPPDATQQEKAKPETAKPSADDLPPEEDEGQKPKVYSFNPIEADRNVKIGLFEMHRGKYAGAASRFEEATKWNPTSAEAFFRLAEAEEKLNNKVAAKTAFERVIQLAPDSKQAHEAKKKIKTTS